MPEVPGLVVEWLGGNCPVQSEGTIDGVPYYFKARGNRWQLFVGQDPLSDPPEFHHQEPYGDTPFAAGWMNEEEAHAFLRKGVAIWRETRRQTA